jgi:hypothetical protein
LPCRRSIVISFQDTDRRSPVLAGVVGVDAVGTTAGSPVGGTPVGGV